MTDLDVCEPIERAVRQRSKQALAAILHVKDQLDLDPAGGDALRRVVLREVNELTELAVALVRSAGPGVNELYVEKLLEIHEAVVGR